MTTTLPERHSSAVNCFVYWGSREGWHVALTVNRDSNALDRSNWAVITESVLAVPNDSPESDDELADAAIESSSHFLCGWVESLVVRPGSSAERRVLEWLDKLEDYPVADETHYSQLEYDEEWCVRCDSATREQHSDEYVMHKACKFRSEEDTREIQYRWRHR